MNTDNMTKHEWIEQDIERLLKQATTDHTGGIIGLGSVWLAAELFPWREKAKMQEKTEETEQ